MSDPIFEILANDTGEMLDTITPIEGRETYARAVHLAVSWSARTGRTVRVKGKSVHIAIAAWKLGTPGSCGLDE